MKQDSEQDIFFFTFQNNRRESLADFANM